MEFEDLKIEVPLELEEEENLPAFLDVPVKKYQNSNSGDFVTGFDVTSQAAQLRRLKRAKRFGIKVEPAANEQEIKALPSFVANLPKTKQDDEIRYDSILLFGVNEMSTKDVFDYFKDYAPGSIEWIDDMSCVVVWDDENSAKRALVSMGTKYTPPKDVESSEDEEVVENVWRIGSKHPKSKQLLMRYAIRSDKKTKGAGTRSLYYLVHGHPNEQKKKVKKKGLISSSRKRKIIADQLRIKEELNSTPEVQFLDVDMDETMETVRDMEIDQPAAKAARPEDTTGDLIPTGNMYADRETDSKSAAMSRLSKPDSGFFVDDELLSHAKMDDEGNSRELDENSWDDSTRRDKCQDLRLKLKNRRKGFNPNTRPNLSIEITENQPT